jgi:hypothetical protein
MSLDLERLKGLLELGALQADPHQWSNRPCPTCRAISGLVGRKFGCYLYAERIGNVQEVHP